MSADAETWDSPYLHPGQRFSPVPLPGTGGSDGGGTVERGAMETLTSRAKGADCRGAMALLGRSLLFVTLSGCASGGHGRAPGLPTPVTNGWMEEGVASWYGEPFHGRRTASGEVYDMHAPTAAHRTLPFGTLVRVDNLTNGRSATLRITDRGPFAKNRILDVSRWGAEELRLLGPGVARVRITVIDAPASQECWEVQAGSFADSANAERLRARLLDDQLPARVDAGPDGLHRVRVGPFEDRGAAERAAGRVGGLLLGCGA